MSPKQSSPKRSVISGALALLALGTTVRPAPACEPPLPCQPSQFVPADGATVPANLVAMIWAPNPGLDLAAASPADFELYELDEEEGAKAVEVEIRPLVAGRFAIQPTGPLAPHSTYQVSADRFCEGEESKAVMRFATAAAAALPTELGPVVASEPFVGPIGVQLWDGTWDWRVDAVQVEVVVELHPDAIPWSDVLIYATRVDGRSYDPVGGVGPEIAEPPPPGASWHGRGRDLLFASCDPRADRGVGQGSHDVQLEAVLPRAFTGDSDLAIDSSAAQIELDCSPAVGSPEQVPPSGAPGTVARSVESGVDPWSATGGGCRAAGRSSGGALLWCLAGLGAIAIGGRRRRRAADSS